MAGKGSYGRARPPGMPPLRPYPEVAEVVSIDVECADRSGRFIEVISVPVDGNMLVRDLLHFVHSRLQRIPQADVVELHLATGAGGRLFAEDPIAMLG